ncbi:TlpA family protein disulfide reductase [Guyparkeria sp.]|uniref:TlpA family protein disulfide reductase n=1 Tax=Guyparkeria sp. TaxID=2035736 RepID=UPI0035673396
MSNRWFAGILAAGLLAVGAMAVAEPASASPRDTPVAFEKDDVHGEPRNLADLRGDIVFINVWASWCPSCVKELPELQAFHEAHRDEGVHVWGLSMDMFRDAERLPEFIGKHGVTYPVINVTPEEASRFGYIEGVPVTFIIGPDGTVDGEYLGPVSREILENMLKSRRVD